LTRAIVIHGHFYQPPRENPWLESVEVQDGAAPFHDWNERVTAECYAPNTAARRVDEQNRILDIVNNFEKISFNAGPTLLAWLDRHRPDVYAKIVAADRASVTARGGHGNAIAQVYNHMIMPLALRRDKVTQVRWGVEDFRARFGRAPEGCWLPETAVDNETLEVLAEAGLRFTILAPHQAWRVRPLGAAAWDEVNDRVDTSHAYRWRGPRGLELALFFYHAPIARGIAFENLLERSEHLVAWLYAAFADTPDRPQLVHCATDGESYGHHRRFGEMALAAAIRQIETDGSAALTNYGAFLAAHPPTDEVEIHEGTSWSCAHGVERWRADCGCRSRSDWQQRWRAPLREALDWLRDQIDPFFEARAGAHLKDPWAARDAYVEVLLDPSPARVDAFFAAHQRTPLDAAARVETRRLFELARHRLLMYTSCGWFFDEISGLEPVQILRYAGIALQHLGDLGGSRLEPEFVRRLESAPSNISALRDGGEVYRRLIRPTAVDLRRVIAHYAITGLFDEHSAEARIYAYRVARLDESREASDDTAGVTISRAGSARGKTRRPTTRCARTSCAAGRRGASRTSSAAWTNTSRASPLRSPTCSSTSAGACSRASSARCSTGTTKRTGASGRRTESSSTTSARWTCRSRRRSGWSRGTCSSGRRATSSSASTPSTPSRSASLGLRPRRRRSASSSIWHPCASRCTAPCGARSSGWRRPPRPSASARPSR